MLAVSLIACSDDCLQSVLVVARSMGVYGKAVVGDKKQLCSVSSVIDANEEEIAQRQRG